MDVGSAPTKDTTPQLERFNELRSKIKQWERSFTETHKRAPTREEMVQAQMAPLYKEYNSLRKMVKPSEKKQKDTTKTLAESTAPNLEVKKHKTLLKQSLSQELQTTKEFKEDDSLGDTWSLSLNKDRKTVGTIITNDNNHLEAPGTEAPLSIKSAFALSNFVKLSGRPKSTTNNTNTAPNKPATTDSDTFNTTATKPPLPTSLATLDTTNKDSTLDNPLFKSLTSTTRTFARSNSFSGRKTNDEDDVILPGANVIKRKERRTFQRSFSVQNLLFSPQKPKAVIDNVVPQENVPTSSTATTTVADEPQLSERVEVEVEPHKESVEKNERTTSNSKSAADTKKPVRTTKQVNRKSKVNPPEENTVEETSTRRSTRARSSKMVIESESDSSSEGNDAWSDKHGDSSESDDDDVVANPDFKPPTKSTRRCRGGNEDDEKVVVEKDEEPVVASNVEKGKDKKKPDTSKATDSTGETKSKPKRKSKSSSLMSGRYKAFKLKSKYKGTRQSHQSKFSKFANFGPRVGSSYSYNNSKFTGQVVGDSENPFKSDGMNTLDDDAAGASSLRLGSGSVDMLDKIVLQEANMNAHTCEVSRELVNKIDPHCSEKVTVNLVAGLRCLTQLDSFRPGQRETVERIVNGQSSLLLMPTGGGKSLCYQLPAFILAAIAESRKRDQKTNITKSLAIVISPTVSLMKDQLRNLPSGLKAGCLNSIHQTLDETNQIIEALRAGTLDILFITPERLQSKSFINIMTEQGMPKVSFACVDEAHCMSEWSHNFRPSYLLIKDILSDRLNVSCFLAMTGSATLEARQSICKMLDIPADGVITSGFIRSNLTMTVSRDLDKDNALLTLLKTSLYKSLDSIIVYVMRQRQAEIVASNLKALGYNADSYHAGKSPADRERAQQRFMNGKLRILVATIAFGLGINKPDVRAIIHYSLPKSIENYVQEIGRAGRDGLTAYCHMFLNIDDYVRLRSLAFSDSVDATSVQTLILKILGQRHEKDDEDEESTQSKKRKRSVFSSDQSANHVLIDISSWEQSLDMKREVMETLIRQMQLDPDRPITRFESCFVGYRVRLFNKLKKRGDQDPDAVDDAIEAVMMNKDDKLLKWIEQKRSTLSNRAYVFNIDAEEACGDLDLTPSELHALLLQLKAKKVITSEPIRPAFFLETKQFDTDTLDEVMSRLRSTLTAKVQGLEKTSVGKVDDIYNILNAAAKPSLGGHWRLKMSKISDKSKSQSTVDKLLEDEEEKQEYLEAIESQLKEEEEMESRLKERIDQYFNSIPDESATAGFMDGEIIKKRTQLLTTLAGDVGKMITQNSVFKSPLQVARILHAIPSPSFPADDWWRNGLWGKYTFVEFERVQREATKVWRKWKLTGDASADSA